MHSLKHEHFVGGILMLDEEITPAEQYTMTKAELTDRLIVGFE